MSHSVEGEEHLQNEEEAKEIEQNRQSQIKAKEAEDEEEGLIPEQEMHAILNIVLTELDFLLDDKVSAEVAREKSRPKEQLLIKLNVLRKVLAIEDENEMTKLLMNIYQDARKRDDTHGQSAFSVQERRNIDVDQYNAREFDNDGGDEEQRRVRLAN